MLKTTLALKAWAVYRIARMVSLSVITVRLASLRKFVVRLWFMNERREPTIVVGFLLSGILLDI